MSIGDSRRVRKPVISLDIVKVGEVCGYPISFDLHFNSIHWMNFWFGFLIFLFCFFLPRPPGSVSMSLQADAFENQFNIVGVSTIGQWVNLSVNQSINQSAQRCSLESKPHIRRVTSTMTTNYGPHDYLFMSLALAFVFVIHFSQNRFGTAGRRKIFCNFTLGPLYAYQKIFESRIAIFRPYPT